MSSASRDVRGPGVGVKFVSAGLAGCVAESATIPIDTAKVRLQVLIIRSYVYRRMLSHSHQRSLHAP